MRYEVEVNDRGIFWRYKGALHRQDGPAIKYFSGYEAWYSHGLKHRQDGPAIKCETGKAWYRNGNLHRKGGPAIEYAKGARVWYIHGRLHRQDGPAVEYPDGYKFWYLNGIELSEKKFMKQKWIEALRSGKYKQAYGWLKCDEGYCCLGVLCEIHPNVEFIEKNGMTGFSYKGEFMYGLLSHHFVEDIKLGLDDMRALSTMNDLRGKTFDEIADWIEKNV